MESQSRREPFILILSVFLVAICGLVYELLVGAVSSYLVGSSITQFSLVIGVFLSSMGVGSFLSKYFECDLISRFVFIEILIGLVGGCSAIVLFFAFAYLENYTAVMLGITGIIGLLSGLEIPLIICILKERESVKVSVSNVLTADYIGALVASLFFPFILVPFLGMMRSAFALGMLNIVVGWLCLYSFREHIGRMYRSLRSLALIAFIVVVCGFIFSANLVSFFEERIYPDEVIYTAQTPYQRIVVTRWHDDTRLFLNGNLQFSSKDEYRYHESLVHPTLSLVSRRDRVLILGGGDGMAARECLKYPDVRSIRLVDLDPKMTDLFTQNELLASLNRFSLRNPRVKITNMDAMEFLKSEAGSYDVVIIDLPDPSVIELGKLYSLTFYGMVNHCLSPGGIIVVQSTSPYFATDSFWCIANTMGQVRTPQLDNEKLHVYPYHVNVPSFGEWGFVMASRKKLRPDNIKLQVPARFLTEESIPALFIFPADIKGRETEINRLDNQVLVRYYTNGYKDFYQ